MPKGTERRFYAYLLYAKNPEAAASGFFLVI